MCHIPEAEDADYEIDKLRAERKRLFDLWTAGVEAPAPRAPDTGDGGGRSTAKCDDPDCDNWADATGSCSVHRGRCKKQKVEKTEEKGGDTSQCAKTGEKDMSQCVMLDDGSYWKPVEDEGGRMRPGGWVQLLDSKISPTLAEAITKRQREFDEKAKAKGEQRNIYMAYMPYDMMWPHEVAIKHGFIQCSCQHQSCGYVH
jgi:hypothetical protein